MLLLLMFFICLCTGFGFGWWIRRLKAEQDVEQMLEKAKRRRRECGRLCRA